MIEGLEEHNYFRSVSVGTVISLCCISPFVSQTTSKTDNLEAFLNKSGNNSKMIPRLDFEDLLPGSVFFLLLFVEKTYLKFLEIFLMISQSVKNFIPRNEITFFNNCFFCCRCPLSLFKTAESYLLATLTLRGREVIYVFSFEFLVSK